jgi:hypothetical protein
MSHDRSFLVSRAEDRACISAVMNRYCWLARENVDFSDMVALFAPGGELVLPDGTVTNPENLGDVIRGSEAHYIRHHITTLDIRWTGEETAESEAFYIAITDEGSIDHFGEWHNSWQKQPNGGWLWTRHHIFATGGAPGGWAHRVHGVGIRSSPVVMFGG